MAPRTSTTDKPRRRKKKKSRTEVSSDSDTEPETKNIKNSKTDEKTGQRKDMSDTEISAAFTKFYMQRMATEFSDDLDRLRSADDFKDDAVPLLISALQQGTSLFSIEEQRRIVMAGAIKENDN